MQRIVPFLTFNGNAQEVMNFYAFVFPNTKIIRVMPYGDMTPNPSEKNNVFHGEMEIMGMTFQFMDTIPSLEQAPAINWSNSYYVFCDSQEEFNNVFTKISAGGEVGMGPEPAGNMRMAASVTDKYGVTWNPIWK